MRVRALTSLISGLGLMVAATGSLPGAPDLISDSPFASPANAAAPVAMTEGGAIELHGIMTTSEVVKFSIFDTAKKSSQWVQVNQAGFPFTVKAHNMVDGNDEVKIDYQGTTLTLALKTPKITAMARPAQGPVVMQPQGPGIRPLPNSAVTQTVVVNPTPADEAARLQAVVDAVAARRAARNQAAQQQAGNALPQAQGNPQNGPGQNQNRPRQPR